MASPRWTDQPGPPLLAGAIAAAVTEAWQAETDDRLGAFRESLRRMIGAEEFERIEFTAYHVFQLQPEPPAGCEDVPSWALFRMCAGCKKVQRTKFTAPQNGRVQLQVLRDKGWMQRQFEVGRTCEQIAASLDCSAANVVRWARVHELITPKAERHEEIEATVRRMHAAGEGPGTIGRELGIPANRVQDVLRRLGLATKKRGQVYHDREWWRVRLEGRGCTSLDCAREAGIRPHAAAYWTQVFGLRELTSKKTRRRKHPELWSPTELRALLHRNGDNYEAAARELGCSASMVSRQARDLLGWAKRHENEVPHSAKSWWEERLGRGATTWEMAEEAGIAEKTASERLRVFGLLAQGYANNTARERAARRSA